jgi:hypothetical protein
MLVAVHFPRTRRHLAVGCLVMLAVPFCLAPWGYVVEQYGACFDKLLVSAQPDLLFEDVRGLVAKLGVVLDDRVWLAVRAAGACGALWLSTQLRSLDSTEGRVRLLAIAALYLLLFNPRTQSNSYVLAAVPIALLIAQSWFAGRRRLAIAGAVVLESWCTYHEAPAWGEHLIKPVGAIIVASGIASKIVMTSRATSAAPRR